MAFTLAALWFVLCRHLSGEWSVNEQYSYGWFVPFFAAFLFWLRWEDRPEAGSRTSEVRDRKRDVGNRISESSPTSDLRPQTSDLRPQTSDLRRPTADFRPPTSGAKAVAI